MGVTNRKEVEINMLKQSTINQRLQESKDIYVLVFSDKKAKNTNITQEVVKNVHQPGNGTNLQNAVITKRIANTYFTVLSG